MKKKVRSRRRAPVGLEKPDKLISVLAIIAVSFFAAASIAWNYSDGSGESILLSPPSSICSIDKELILHYDFTKVGDGDPVVDLTGNGYSGDLLGSSGGQAGPNYRASGPATELTGQYLEFDGYDDVVRVLNSQDLQFDSDKTVCFWRKPISQNEGGVLFSKGITTTVSSEPGFRVSALDSNPTRIQLRSGGGLATTGGLSNAWVFVCNHFSPDSNNKLVVYAGDMTTPTALTQTADVVETSEFIHVGGHSINGQISDGDSFFGYIDDVTVWDGLLDNEERNILKNYYYEGLASCNTLPGGDVELPFVYVTDPIQGEAVVGTIDLAADANDNKGIQRVEFYEGNTLLDTAYLAPYTAQWDTIVSSNGQRSVTAKAYDLSGNVRTSSAVTVFVNNLDVTAPDLSIQYPLPSSSAGNYESHVTQLNFIASDLNLVDCWYSLNNGVTNVSVSCQSGVTYSVSGISSVSGSQTWRVWARDTGGNIAAKSTTFFVQTPMQDPSAPIVSISYPQNGVTYNTAVTNITFTITEPDPGKCWFTGNNGANNHTFSGNTCGSASGQTLTKPLSGLTSTGEGTFTWKIYANDTLGNVGSASVMFIVNLSLPVQTCGWIAQTTSCSADDTQTVYYTSATCTTGAPANITQDCDYDGNGIIGEVSDVQTSNVDLEIFVDDDELDLDGDYSEEDVEIRDDDDNLIVSFEYDFGDEPLNFREILIKKQSSVTQYGYLIVKGIDADKTFRVDRVAGASRVCIRDRDDVDSAADFTSGCTHSSEDLINCPGSGGGYTCAISGEVFVVDGLENSAVREFTGNLSGGGANCVPDWDYGLWGSCIGGTRTRTVDDLNNCGVLTGRLPSSESCVSSGGGACTPNWQCGEWSPNECPASGVRTRTCTDLNACGISSGRPSESASCVEGDSEFNFPLIMAIVLAALGTLTLVVVVILYIRRKKRAKMYASSSYSASHYASGGSGSGYSYSGSYSRK